MFSLSAIFPEGNVEMLGFVSSNEEVDAILDTFCSKYGTEFIATSGVKFNVELAA